MALPSPPGRSEDQQTLAGGKAVLPGLGSERRLSFLQPVLEDVEPADVAEGLFDRQDLQDSISWMPTPTILSPTKGRISRRSAAAYVENAVIFKTSLGATGECVVLVYS